MDPNEKFENKHVDEAILKTFSSIDSPTSPGSRCLDYFTLRMDRALVNQNRQALLSMTREQIVEAARKHLLPEIEKLESADSKASIVAVGREDFKLEDPSKWQRLSPKKLEVPFSL
jgi:Zn-dependent M16 (insulinase) family peptidase